MSVLSLEMLLDQDLDATNRWALWWESLKVNRKGNLSVRLTANYLENKRELATGPWRVNQKDGLSESW